MAEKHVSVRYNNILKSLLFSFLFGLVPFLSLAQYGHEWINPANTYYRFSISDSGLYAIPLTQLSAAGMNVSDPTKIQLWRRGVEQAINIANSTVYFYGVPND